MLFSDGAFELRRPDGRPSNLVDFVTLVKELLDADHFSIDSVIDELRSRSVDATFDDDCSLITAEFH